LSARTRDDVVAESQACCAQSIHLGGDAATTRWILVHPPGDGWAPSGIARPVELRGPLGNRRRRPRVT